MQIFPNRDPRRKNLGQEEWLIKTNTKGGELFLAQEGNLERYAMILDGTKKNKSNHHYFGAQLQLAS